MKFTAIFLLPVLAIAAFAAPISQSQNPRALIINTAQSLSPEFTNFSPAANKSLRQKMASMKRVDGIFKEYIQTYKSLKTTKRANSEDDEELRNAAISMATGTAQMLKSVDYNSLSASDKATYRSTAQSAGSSLGFADQIVNALLAGFGTLTSILNSFGLLDLLGAILPNPL